MLYYIYDSEHIDTEITNSEKTVVLSETEIQKLADEYLEISPYSRDGLEKELVQREKIDSDSVEKALDSFNVNWNEQAFFEAKELLSYDGYSEKMVRKNLKNDGFTEEQIDYAVEHCNADWNEQALKKANIYIASGVGHEHIKANLLADGFTEEQSTYGAENTL